MDGLVDLALPARLDPCTRLDDASSTVKVEKGATRLKMLNEDAANGIGGYTAKSRHGCPADRGAEQGYRFH